jgi:hypothetical protein
MKFYFDPWQAGDTFEVNQMVTYNGSAYKCNTAHTATSTFDATKFTIFTGGSLGTWTSRLRSAFYNPNIIAVDCVRIQIPDTDGVYRDSAFLRYCTGGINMTLDETVNGTPTTRTYTAQGDFMGFTTITEEFDVKVGRFEIQLSGLSTGIVQRFTGETRAGIDFEGCRVEIWRLFLDYETMELINNQRYPMFDGVIYNSKIVESAVSCTITIECATLWADFERKKGRRSNNESNWLFQGNKLDYTFCKTATAGQVEFKWGRK